MLNVIQAAPPLYTVATFNYNPTLSDTWLQAEGRGLIPSLLSGLGYSFNGFELPPEILSIQILSVHSAYSTSVSLPTHPPDPSSIVLLSYFLVERASAEVVNPILRASLRAE